MNRNATGSGQITSHRRSDTAYSGDSGMDSLLRIGERLKLVQAATGTGIWDVDLVTGENEWSDELYRLLGLDPQESEANFEVWKSTIHPEDRDISWANLENAVNKKIALDIDYRIVHKSGEIHWIRAIGNTIYDEDGKPVRMLGICLDITTQRQKEDRIQELAIQNQHERDRLTALINSINDEIWFADVDKKITLVNPSVLKQFGYGKWDNPEIADVTSSLEICKADGSPRQPDEAPLLRSLNGELIKNEEEIIKIASTGTLLHRELNSSPVKDSNGVIIGAICAVRDITERKLVEQSLKASKEWFVKVFNKNPVAMSISKIDGEIVDVNNEYVRLFGYPRKELIGRSGVEAGIYFDPSERDNLLDGFFEKGSIHNVEVSFKHKNGTLVRTSCSLEKIILNNEPHILGTAIDLSYRIESENSLRESEQRFRQLANAMPQLVWTANPEGLVDYYNDRCNEFEGFYQDENGNWIWEIAIHEDDLKFTREAWHYALETGTMYQVEHRVKMKSGDYKWHLSRGVPAFDAGGKIIKWYGTATDINDRKITEEELKRSREKLELALENANIGLWEVNVRTKKTLLDERSQKMFGLVPGSSEIDTYEKLVHEEDLDHIKMLIDNTVKNKVPYETIFRTKPLDGKYRYISAKATDIKDEQGEILYLWGVNFDITDLKEGTERLVSKLNMDLLRSNSDLQQFAYVASHDLQEPLRMISSFTQLLKKRYGDSLDQNAKEYIDYAVNGSKRMYELINGLLAYSRVQTRPDDFTIISMDGVLSKVEENLKLLINETKTVITSDHLPEVTADENQMIQVLQNLIENGIKFSNKTPRVHISSERRAGDYTFSVKDEGIGIDSQYFEKIFRIFQKLHTPGEYKGTGIGLAICKRIVERHGGEMWVESEPGMGTTFFFTIPA